jgi:hypothetical protein
MLWIRLCGGFGAGPDQDFQSAALDLFGIARVDEVARGQDERPRGEDFGLPEAGKAEVEGGRGHGWAL